MYNQEIKLALGIIQSQTPNYDYNSEWRIEEYGIDWCNQEELYRLGCDKQTLDHLYTHSNLFDKEFDGNYVIATIGLPEGMAWENLLECVDVILGKRLPSHEDLNISQLRVENFCTEKPWICYGTFDNGTEIRIACDFPMHGCLVPFDKDNFTGLENEN